MNRLQHAPGELAGVLQGMADAWVQDRHGQYAARAPRGGPAVSALHTDSTAERGLLRNAPKTTALGILKPARCFLQCTTVSCVLVAAPAFSSTNAPAEDMKASRG